MITAQTDERHEAMESGRARTGAGRGATWLSLGGLVGAAASGACCVIPFALFTLGASGAWLGRLTALAPYQPVFITATLLCLAVGFVLVRRASRATCADGVACTRPGSLRLVRIALWAASILVAAALLFPYAVRPFVEG
ncbi:MAG: mercuric transporter MerT family protein [Candidatus Rokuibacteriota bacterium]